jgi:glycosyltransferase involved in cell wall biosynthesis
VEFCGVFSSEQMGEILNQIDVIIVPSIWYENTPIMLLEALASDVPAVVTDLGGMTEVVKDNINGRAFRISDPDHLAQALSSMVDDPEILNTYKDNIKSQFIPSVEQEGLAYQREYQAICQAKAGE